MTTPVRFAARISQLSGTAEQERPTKKAMRRLQQDLQAVAKEPAIKDFLAIPESDQLSFSVKPVPTHLVSPRADRASSRTAVALVSQWDNEHSFRVLTLRQPTTASRRAAIRDFIRSNYQYWLYGLRVRKNGYTSADYLFPSIQSITPAYVRQELAEPSAKTLSRALSEHTDYLKQHGLTPSPRSRD